MVFHEVPKRLVLIFSLLIGFGLISMVNGLLIRMAVKCSLLSIFPLLRINEIIQNQGRRNTNNRRHVYAQMGGVGALAAYLDRNERSKGPIYFQLFVTLLTYYTMYSSSYKLWTTLMFN